MSELELKEYKKQQQESAGLLDTMDVAERQPVFLKEKGDALYAQGNFHGAINAYSTALQMDPNHLLSLSNRAACWLKLKAADRCLADCDDALELLRPRLKRWETGDASEEELTKFKRTFTRVLARKGAAHVQVCAASPPSLVKLGALSGSLRFSSYLLPPPPPVCPLPSPVQQRRNVCI